MITHEHGWAFEGEPLKVFLDRELIARGGTMHIAVSRADQERMTSIERIKPKDTVFVPNGISEPLPAPSGKDVRAELGIAPDTPLVGTMGFLRYPKAIDNLVRAADPLRRLVPGVKVLVAGDGPDRPMVEGLIDELDLHDTVMLLGLRSDVPDLLAALDVAVCPSDSEGSPLSIMEYMDAGLPVVSTNVGGVPDLIDDGVHGLLVPRRDPEALARAMAELLRDRRARRGDGPRGPRAARARVRHRRDGPQRGEPLRGPVCQSRAADGLARDARDRCGAPRRRPGPLLGRPARPSALVGAALRACIAAASGTRRPSSAGTWSNGFYREVWEDAAERLGGAGHRPGSGFLEITADGVSTRVWRQLTAVDEAVSLRLALDKARVHKLLVERGVTVPEHREIDRLDAAAGLDFIAAVGGRLLPEALRRVPAAAPG